jgi:hypothetical protein
VHSLVELRSTKNYYSENSTKIIEKLGIECFEPGLLKGYWPSE